MVGCGKSCHTDSCACKTAAGRPERPSADGRLFGDGEVKGLPGFGKPRRQRSVQYGYSAPAAHWHRIREHAPLVIAALGSFVFVAIAATAIWFALPRDDRQVLADATPQEMTSPPVAEAEAAIAEPPALQAATPAEAAPAAVAAAPAPQPESTGEPELEPLALMEEPQVPALDAKAAAAIIVTDGEVGDTAEPASGPQTAAIPAPKPKPPEPKADTPKAAAATGNGRIIRGVTFRAGPGGSAIGTIPAGTDVKVISCGSWCEIVHDGKQGFVYKTFLKRD